jgi:bifunctional non-homologous end joining protein LigD
VNRRGRAMVNDLAEYQSRRDFARTQEPRGVHAPKRAPAGSYSYVVQKHAARKLHYDFRLELDGVLLSWAVPKGPSLDPQVKRLAVEVEPHPVEYGSFEGEIADGQYGAGSVMVWDTGTWEPLDKDPRAAHEKGHLSFVIHGQKLQGAWHLVRTSRGNAQKGWLLFKANDEYADAKTDILTSAPNSAVSGLSIDQLGHPSAGEDQATPKVGAGRSPKRRAKRSAPVVEPGGPRLDEIATYRGAKRAPLPDQLEVQLATLVQAPAPGDDWVHEIKFDGYRVVVRVNDGAVQLLTRRSLDWTDRMPLLAAAISELELPNVILDGEFVALDEQGVSNFQALQNSLGAMDADNLFYYAFDLLHYDGVDIRGLPLLTRKALLRELLLPHLSGPAAARVSRVRLSEHVRGSGVVFFEQACKLGLEGIVSKRAEAAYVGARSRDWLKAKCSKRQEFVVIGYTEPAGSRSHLGALLVAVYDGANWVYCGRVGTGFTTKSLGLLASKLKPLAAERPALSNAPKGAHARGVHWVTPTLVVEVAHMGFTQDGILRHPTFEGLREDKVPTEVRREIAEPTPTVAKAPSKEHASAAKPPVEAVQVPDTSHVKLTNPTKVLYPSVGVTKRELLDYAAMVANRLLPHVVNRPLTLVRCPNGEDKQCFFQKHPGVSAPGLRAVDIREKEGKADYAVIDSAEGLFSLVQLGVLEIHTSGAEANDFEHPDVLVFDLDPDPTVEFAEVIRCARRLKEIFDSASLESFVKTTGGKGLHVCIPVEPKLSWTQAKLFTQHVATALVKEEPKRYIATQSKAQRAGKIFIDYLRNGRGATFVAPYSTRARPTAPVATPVFWEELTPDLRPDRFTVRNLAERLSQMKQDPFERMARLHQTLPGNLLR